MPVCVHCAYPVKHLYTVYKTKSNIRLGVCPQCDQFLDPLIEHPTLILILDLVLLKSRVYLHLLFNRGAPPLETTVPDIDFNTKRRSDVWTDMIMLSAMAVIAETTLRILASTSIPEAAISESSILRTTVLVVLELLAQHLTTTLLTLVVLRVKGWYPSSTTTTTSKTTDGRQINFLPALIPLTLLYSSLLPLLLQLFLMIYYRPPTTSIRSVPSPQAMALFPPFAQELVLEATRFWNGTDRLRAGTRLLGGMSSGFGLRVLLPTKPWETTVIVLAGWVAAAGLGNAVQSMWSLI
ncbi:Arv1-like family-domain-containing protein [Naematelia encephala]|uniref:Protein ARV n=1 Tax=Naematelia encephala TaxID=71784 RepID=A0A1Y2BKR6_9TREE|nr:Arv1-like family-domain-containing protein [Naematelia encephala]